VSNFKGILRIFLPPVTWHDMLDTWQCHVDSQMSRTGGNWRRG